VRHYGLHAIFSSSLQYLNQRRRQVAALQIAPRLRLNGF
jgi:hypothetical protein